MQIRVVSAKRSPIPAIATIAFRASSKIASAHARSAGSSRTRGISWSSTRRIVSSFPMAEEHTVKQRRNNRCDAPNGKEHVHHGVEDVIGEFHGAGGGGGGGVPLSPRSASRSALLIDSRRFFTVSSGRISHMANTTIRIVINQTRVLILLRMSTRLFIVVYRSNKRYQCSWLFPFYLFRLCAG